MHNIVLYTRLSLLIILMGCVCACKMEDAPSPCMDVTNPHCVNYNPCYGVQSVTADFEMWAFDPVLATGGPANFSQAFISEDSIFQPTCVYFKAKLKGANYLWQLGSQTMTDSGDYRYFSALGNPGVYRVYYNTLTVTKNPNYFCYPNDTNYATQTRSITIVRPSQLLTSGVFKVKYEGHKDSIMLQILTWNSLQPTDTSSSSTRLLIGFPDMISDSVYIWDDDFTNRLIRFRNSQIKGRSLRPYDGYFRVNPVDYTVYAEYDKDIDIGEQRVKKHYRCWGRKIK